MNPIRIKLLVLLLIGIFVSITNSATPPKYGGVMKLAVFQRFITLDPIIALTDIEYCISDSLFDGLVRLDRNGKALPCIASSWEISEDQKTYTFHISESAKFHNGRKINADDIKYSWQRSLINVESCILAQSSLELILGANDYRSGKLKEIEGLKIIDSNTIQVLLEKPDNSFLMGLTVSSAWIVPKEAVQKADFSQHPIGSGPFKIDVATGLENEVLHLTANENHVYGHPYLDGIIFIYAPDFETALLQFETDEIDCLEIPNIDFSKFRSDPTWSSQLTQNNDNQIIYIQINRKSFPVKAKISDVLKYGIDVPSILNMIYNQGKAISNDYQPEKARKLSQESQVNPAKLIVFDFGDDLKKISDRIALDLTKIGFAVNVSSLNRNDFQKALADKTYSLALRILPLSSGEVEILSNPAFVPLFYYNTNVLEKSDVQHLPNLVGKLAFRFEDMYFLRLPKGEN
jgi:ABC-type transport system substrate-binding protein